MIGLAVSWMNISETDSMSDWMSGSSPGGTGVLPVR